MTDETRRTFLGRLAATAGAAADMRALADWLRPRVVGLTVTHLPAGDAFTYV